MIPRIQLDDALLLELYRQGVPTKEIGKRLGCSDSVVCKRAKTAGLPPRCRCSGTRPSKWIVTAYVQHRLSLAAIAKLLRDAGDTTLGATTVKSILLARGVKLRKRQEPPPGAASAHDCVRLFRMGWSRVQIAKHFHMSRDQVARRIWSILGPGIRGVQHYRTA